MLVEPAAEAGLVVAIGNERALAMMGVGFGVAIFIDAFIIRLLLLPAVMHLAGPAKRTRYTVRRTGGGSFETCIVRGSSPSNPVACVPPPAGDSGHRTRAA